MSENVTTILFVGDMHLGRQPARVPARTTGAALPPASALGPGAAWLRVAREAVRRQVDAVALAGDVVESANGLIEGAAELGAGLRILQDAAIPVLAVAGNHDTRVLPDVARRGEITLLGPGGTWTHKDVGAPGRPMVRIAGWSFPEQHWPDSPLATPPPPALPDGVTLGLLHADLDAPGSRYAPVDRRALAATGYTGWLLGHVHLPGRPVAGGNAFYLGSLCGMDPTETGTHGPVLVTIGAGGQVALERLPLAPLRWVEYTLSLDSVVRPDIELGAMVANAMEHASVSSAAPGDDASAIGIHLTVRGAVEDPVAVARTADKMAEERLSLAIGSAVAFLVKLDVDVHIAHDLAQLAAGEDPPGLLARRILVLEGAAAVPGIDDPTTWRQQLLADAHRCVDRVDQTPGYARLPDGVADVELCGELARVARSLLDHLLPGRGGRHAADPN